MTDPAGGSGDPPAGYAAADLAYFRHLIEGDDVVGWVSWWSQNQARLRTRLPRAEFLRLKFHRLDHAASVLTTAGIGYSWTPLGRARQQASNLDPRYLDEAGLPTPAWFQRLGELASAVDTGDPVTIHRAAGRQVARARRSRRPGEQALGELVGDAEMLHELGSSRPDRRYRAAATALLEAVAQVNAEDDVDEGPAVHAAKAVLARLRRADDAPDGR